MASNISESSNNETQQMTVENKDSLAAVLTELLQYIRRNNQLYDKDFKDRNHVEENIMMALKKVYHEKDIELNVLGSSGTKLITKKSDLNYTFHNPMKKEPKKTSKNVQQESASEVMERMEANWRSDPMISALFYDIHLVRSEGDPKSRPRLKFKTVKSGIPCDLAFDNKIGIQSSRLMSAYVEWDERFLYLAHSMKHLARVCKIDLSVEDGVSSYAFVLMVVYFLQKTRPPVLPVLQEMFVGTKPTDIVDGCDVWFLNDPPMHGVNVPNTKKMWELWLDMLKFYGQDFDCRVVIATHTRMTFQWGGSTLCVVDPFDPKNNVCDGLTSDMNSKILKVFQNAWKRFETPPEKISWSGQIENYYFNHDALVGVPIPVPSINQARSKGSNNQVGSSQANKKQEEMGQRSQRDHQRRRPYK